MKILVIGGAGYIGSHVVKDLLKAGHNVTVFDNLSSGLRENLFPDAHFAHGDILHYPALVKQLQSGFDALFHFAAFKAAGESMTAPEKYSRNNIAGTLNVLNAMSETGVSNIVFSSSSAVYGSPEYLPLNEEHPKEPINYYGFTKLEIERFMGWYDRIKGIKYAALRYFNAAGYDVEGVVKGVEQTPTNLLPVTMEAACGMRPKLTIFGTDYDTADGTCIRDYIHVNDLATGHLLALDYLAKNRKSLAVNLATGEGNSVMEVYQKAKEITGIDIPMELGPRRPGDPSGLYASGEYAKALLGFEAQYSDLDTLISTTWNVYKEL